MAYKIKVRDRSHVTKDSTSSMAELFDLVQQHAAELISAAPTGSVKSVFRDYGAIEQVRGRIEISGPKQSGVGRAHAGLDVRGDGSTEAYVGRMSRAVVEQLPGESAVVALLRSFAAIARQTP